MAGNIEESEDIDDQLLTCAVCKLRFRDPRILPCLHTFCKECLDIWATKQQPLKCPTCRRNVTLPDQGVDGLRTNIYVNNLLDFAAVKKGAEPGVPCQVCEGKEGGARVWCVQCAVLLCESCTNTHNRFPTMKGHQIVTQEDLKATEFQRKSFCPKHEGQVLIFYCEPCQTLVCAACAVVDHRLDDEHKPVEIGDIAEKKKLGLQELLGKVDDRAKEVRAAVNDAGKEISELLTSTDTTIEQATVCFDHLITLVQDRKTEVINDIESSGQEVTKCLETQKEAIEFELSGLTSASEFGKQALEHGSDAHVIVAEGQARQRVEELLTTPTDLTVRPSQVVFSEGTAVAGLRENMKKAGCVQVTSKADVSKCSVEVNPAVVDVSSFTLLRTLDKNGHLCFVPKDDVTVTLKEPFGHDLPTSLQEKGRGLWEISYMPKLPGNHTLEVKVNGQPVAGRPFYVKVQYSHTPDLTIGKQSRGTGGENFGPVDVAVDTAGNIVVVDGKRERVHVFDPKTGQSLRHGTHLVGERPCGIDIDSNGRFTVASSCEGSQGVRVYSQKGALVERLFSDRFRELRGVAVLQNGRMVVSDKQEKSCFLLQPDKGLIREVGKGQLQDPWFIAADESRDLFYVTDGDANKVFAFDLDGKMTFCFGETGPSEGQFLCPSGITLDPEGNIIVVNFLDGRLQVFKPDGKYLRTVAKVNNFPSGIALTPNGHIAVACYWEHCVELHSYS
ncbi:PREDICTED: tripartite motif-containing protein 3-like [Branchiostoma belcheri]|uniref:RING-type E3 ubiquitin transferase n=1 Tax=Branchiostoma belcheri TaxID=7741 RepID=A0A6P4Z405_BRABE|nr:PREDICTED: tripartite motif-containing protein 3-like [Branchiostoma belcheri]